MLKTTLKMMTPNGSQAWANRTWKSLLSFLFKRTTFLSFLHYLCRNWLWSIKKGDWSMEEEGLLTRPMLDNEAQSRNTDRVGGSSPATIIVVLSSMVALCGSLCSGCIVSSSIKYNQDSFFFWKYICMWYSSMKQKKKETTFELSLCLLIEMMDQINILYNTLREKP